MSVDVEIYIKNLKRFFNNDRESREEMFGHVDMEEFFILATEQAENNIIENGDPVLSHTQMLDIITLISFRGEELYMQDIDMTKIFKTIVDGMPPICLN
mgnify:FL=1|tara:strand:+ start:180 stop:476 length:297 start_codon:yes stop_codon:yes gene_type:complete